MEETPPSPHLRALPPQLPLTRCSGGTLPRVELGSCLLPWSHLNRARGLSWTWSAPGTGTASSPCQESQQRIRRGGVDKERTERVASWALSLTGDEPGQKAGSSGSCWGVFAGEAWKQEGKAGGWSVLQSQGLSQESNRHH